MRISRFFVIAGILSTTIWSACKDDDVPPQSDPKEIITDIRLIFSSQEGGAPLNFSATDPDGEGPEDLQAGEGIALKPNTTYDLFIEFGNSISGEDVTEEIEAEGKEHIIFFAFTNNIFEYPEGDGNIDAPEEFSVIYADTDANGLPIGLITSWRTGGEVSEGTFRVVLKHQPDRKSEEADATIGATDVDVSWNLSIAE